MNIYEHGIERRLTWDSQDVDDVNKALEFFMKLTRQGWIAVKKDGEYGRVLEFKPEYEELLFYPVVDAG